MQDPVLDNKNDAHTFVARLSDEKDVTIDFMTKMIIDHEKSNGIVTISKPFYCDINLVTVLIFYEDKDLTKGTTLYRLKTNLEWYRFKNTVILDEEEKLVISVISPNRNIEKIKFVISPNRNIEKIKFVISPNIENMYTTMK